MTKFGSDNCFVILKYNSGTLQLHADYILSMCSVIIICECETKVQIEVLKMQLFVLWLVLSMTMIL